MLIFFYVEHVSGKKELLLLLENQKSLRCCFIVLKVLNQN